MGRRRRSLLDPRGVGSRTGTTAGDEGEVDWRSQEGSEFEDDIVDSFPSPALQRPAVSQPLHTPVRFSSSSGPTLVNDTPDSGADPMSTPFPGMEGVPRRLQPPSPSHRGAPLGEAVPPGYQRPTQPVDAPVAQDLFGEGGYDDFDGASPPTDEFPAQVMEDVGQPYTTPFSVPDAPPIPGIVDRFTPPPAHRTEIGSRRKKPDYLAETPHAKDRYQPTPSPVKRKTAVQSAKLATTGTQSGKDRIARAQEPEEEAPGVSPLSLWIGIGGVLFFLVGVVSLVVTLLVVVMSAGPDEEAEPGREPVSGGVEIRDDMTDPPAPIADPNAPPPTPDPTQAPSPAPPTPDPKAKAVVPPEAPRPAAPGPAPASATAPVQGKLKIRSNRKVLVYVGDQAIGYTPKDVPVEPGKYRVTAKLPGQPNSQQGRDAVMTEKRQDILVEFSF